MPLSIWLRHTPVVCSKTSNFHVFYGAPRALDFPGASIPSAIDALVLHLTP